MANINEQRIYLKFWFWLVVRQFLPKNNISRPPHSPDLAPRDIFLFLILKFEMKGNRFGSAEGIQVESLDVLNIIYSWK